MIVDQVSLHLAFSAVMILIFGVLFGLVCLTFRSPYSGLVLLLIISGLILFVPVIEEGSLAHDYKVIEYCAAAQWRNETSYTFKVAENLKEYNIDRFYGIALQKYRMIRSNKISTITIEWLPM